MGDSLLQVRQELLSLIVRSAAPVETINYEGALGYGFGNGRQKLPKLA
jgi:hypothetical protein